jgi:hypothetical protein
MLRRLVISATIAVATGGVAHAKSSFDLFQNVCLNTGGDHAAAMAAPELAGWSPAPKALIDQLTAAKSKDDVYTNVEALIKQESAGVTLVVVAHVNRIADGVNVPGNVCGVAAAPMDGDAIKAQVAAYAAVPMNQDLVDAETDAEAKQHAVIYAWRNDAGRHVGLSMPELSAAKPGDPILVLTALAQGPLTLVGLAVPAK